MLVQHSLLELLRLGVHDLYTRTVDPKALTAIGESVGPGWMPMTLALEHYRACDELGLSDDQIEAQGNAVGRKLQDALFVSPGKTSSVAPSISPWSSVDTLARIGRRIYLGGSAEYVKLAENELQIESVGNLLFEHRYFRMMHLCLLRCALSAIGLSGVNGEVTHSRREPSAVEVRVTWT